MDHFEIWFGAFLTVIGLSILGCGWALYAFPELRRRFERPWKSWGWELGPVWITVVVGALVTSIGAWNTGVAVWQLREDHRLMATGLRTRATVTQSVKAIRVQGRDFWRVHYEYQD